MGAMLHLELLTALAVDHGPDHVGRQQIGGKLDAAVIGIDKLGQRFDGQGLRQARHPLQQDMPIGQAGR